ncbi:hypothetical protein CVV38_00890 [Candidatus Peregrinibacteria bacterium HGW-Peregrinibacteria-1]|jgi:vancomycin permeability regulator SanA|nr:MAG: hypothetical protein CVV38_00890 [Candidatus Peregrinibacteria bacterium HGW-Peregrinibacteria-1]
MKAKEEKIKLFKTILWGLAIALIVIFSAPFLVVQYYRSFIYISTADIPKTETAIVFGASIKPDGSPSDILKDRLDIAAALYKEGIVSQILVTGDNINPDYNEPGNMLKYLVQTHRIPESQIIKDPAGLRTYDSCIRAKEIWEIDEAILITQGYHLARALFTCNHLGVKSTGFSATNQPYIKADYFKFREVGAIYKAIIDVYFWRPDYQKF